MFMTPNVLDRGVQESTQAWEDSLKIRKTFKLFIHFQHFIQILCSRSVYPFTTPGAFVPHSAINLSRTKEEESPVSQSLDLSVSEAGATSSAVSSAGP